MQSELNKNKLLDTIRVALNKLEYSAVPGSNAAPSTFFKSANDLVLSLGIEISSTRRHEFTASFYLAPTFSWSYIPKGFPVNAYCRVGEFLSDSERSQLLDDKQVEPGLVDIWWSGFTEANALKLVQAVGITERRFLEQTGVVDAILNCDAIKNRAHVIIEISRRAQEDNYKPRHSRRFQPSQYAQGIHQNWYYAAEDVLVDSKREVNANLVSSLAVDAWRMTTAHLLPRLRSSFE